MDSFKIMSISIHQFPIPADEAKTTLMSSSQLIVMLFSFAGPASAARDSNHPSCAEAVGFFS